MNKLISEALLYIPGGVNSPVRSFKNVIDDPIFIKKSQGSKLIDENGKEYIDLVCSWGAVIAGHSNTIINNSVKNAVDDGLSFGTVTVKETTIAKQVCSLIPAIEKVRFVNSGTEACMSAIRLARGYTNKKYIIKFEGCYHGHADSLLVKAGSGALSFGVPDSAGVPEEIAKLTITLPYNDTDAFFNCMDKNFNNIAAVIIEPVAGNMNMIPANKEFLKTVRNYCTELDTILIFDEVMSGFRVALSGAQSVYNITPDLVCLGKVIGGGLPVGAFGGKKEIMDMLAPLGPVYQAGTLSGNPITLSAGISALQIIQEPNFFNNLEKTAKKLTEGLCEKAKKHSVDFSARYMGGMIGLFFTATAPNTFAESELSNDKNFNMFFHSMLKQGIYLAPSKFEAGFISSAHTDEDINKIIKAADISFAEISEHNA